MGPSWDALITPDSDHCVPTRSMTCLLHSSVPHLYPIQVELLLSLAPRYSLGVFSSATFKTVKKGLSAIQSYLHSNRCTAKHRESRVSQRQ